MLLSFLIIILLLKKTLNIMSNYKIIIFRVLIYIKTQSARKYEYEYNDKYLSLYFINVYVSKILFLYYT